MKIIGRLVLLAAILLFPTKAFAWNCTNPLDARVPVPAGTAGTFGDGSGQLFLGTSSEGVAGQLYECEPPGTNPPAGTINTNTNQNSNSNSNSNKNTSSSTSSATGGNSSSTATGGSSTSTNLNNNVATATGGAGGAGGSATATGGSVKDSGNSSSTSTVKNSGNSSISNSGNSHQKQNQSQSQSSTSSATGNGDNSNNETTNVPRQVASAFAPPVFPTVSCFKGVSVGAQAPLGGVSFGGGKIDENCATLEAARQARNLLVYCKIYTQNKYVKRAGVTMEDCLGPAPAPVAVVVPTPEPVPAPTPIIVEVQPTPVVVQEVAAAAPVVVAPTPINPELKKKSVKRVKPPCYTNDELERMGVPANKLPQ